jgi:tetratricopeptide (TPR) repeat protein
LTILGDQDELSHASATTLRGLIKLDVRDTKHALDDFLQALAVREKLLPGDDPFIASSLNAISIAQTELGQLDAAEATGNRAIEIRLATDRDRIGNSYSNMASTLLRMKNPDRAESTLAQCPSLKDFSDDTFLKSGNPRFAG